MANSQYKRVSRKRACRICGKSDWCSYTPNEKISFCARIIEGADRVSRNGWGVFYHEKSLFGDEPVPFPRKLPPKKAELAPLEIRDFVYRKLIELSPATNSKEIIDGPKGLRARKILDFENYGSLPQSRAERAFIAKQIRAFLNKQYPDYVRKRKSSIAGLPGFWLDKTGKVQLWLEKNYSFPLMLIPYRDAKGLIQACQIRLMSKMVEGFRYVWLSTPEKSDGVSCGSPLHFASYNATLLAKPVLVTEGALKAETTRIFKTDFDVLANSGVSCSHDEITTMSRFRPLFIVFDNDYQENPHVARSLARLLSSLFLDSVKFQFQPRIKILSWSPKVKGIDDAFLQNVTITTKTPFEWFKSLSSDSQNKIRSFLVKTILN